MKTHAALVLLFVGLNCILYARAEKFAVLVATTKSWLHYGHQSTVLHAYQTLIANGFPRANIVTMFYDDIANHKSNPEPGIVRNHPRGPNVYENVKKDYTGEKVTANNFMGVITGNESLARGPVIKSTGPKDTLFVYIVGLSSYQYLTFPTGPGIAARKLVQTMEKLTSDHSFCKIYVTLDVSFGASLFDGIVSPTSKVFISAATSSEEHPHAVYCIPEKRTCHGSLYGVAWTQYSDRLRQLKSGFKRTLYDQFNHVRAETPYTHVNMYGDLSVGQSRLSEFISYKHEGRPHHHAASSASSKLGLALATPHRVSFDGDSFESKNHSNVFSGDNYDHLLDAEGRYAAKKNRNFIAQTMKNIFDRLQGAGYENIRYEKAAKNRRRVLSAHHSDVYEEAIRQFHRTCININENPFALREISKLAHLCENDVDLSDLTAAMAKTCTTQHRLTLDVY